MTKIVLLAILSLPAQAFASIAAPNSSMQVSPDGSRVLVMLSDAPEGDSFRTTTLPDGRTSNVRETFPKSGAYDAKTLRPIWQVDWYDHPWNLRWSDDFRFVVCINPNALGPNPTSALQFYDEGKLIRAYKTSELVVTLCNPMYFDFTTSGWHRVWDDVATVDSAKNTFDFSSASRRLGLAGHWVDLGLQESYTFDLTTGSILKQRTMTWRIVEYVVAAIFICPTLYFSIRSLARFVALQRSKHRRGFPMPQPAVPTLHHCLERGVQSNRPRP